MYHFITILPHEIQVSFRHQSFFVQRIQLDHDVRKRKPTETLIVPTNLNYLNI